MEDYGSHYSVFLRESIDWFKSELINEKLLFVDCTFGGGGHSFEILKTFPKSSLLAFDQDPDAFENGLERIKKSDYSNRIQLVNSNFVNFIDRFKESSFYDEFEGKVDGVVIDLGVSSHQFDKPERGFSYRFDGDLDMRMNYKDSDLETAKDIVNTYAEEDIANIIFEYGEERLSRRIAANIVEARKNKKIETTKELEEIVFLSYPKKFRHGRTHPATKTFQALRIYVNRELDVLENVILDLYNHLNTDGILQIISFHSLEDRIVKHKFKNIYNNDKERCKILTKKPILPSLTELDENSRSRSAKLRILKRLIQEV